MHDNYDEEMATGNDEPTFVVGPANKKELGISSEGKPGHILAAAR